MRHRNSGRRLNRTSSHRKAMFRNMMCSLFTKECIKTTLIKAKELRGFAEPMITLAKADSVANRRLAFNRLRDAGVVNKLFSVLGKRFAKRPGGYLRLLKCGFRAGDTAPMAIVELVEDDAAKEVKKAPSKKPKNATKSKASKKSEKKEAPKE